MDVAWGVRVGKLQPDQIQLSFLYEAAKDRVIKAGRKEGLDPSTGTILDYLPCNRPASMKLSHDICWRRLVTIQGLFSCPVLTATSHSAYAPPNQRFPTVLPI